MWLINSSIGRKVVMSITGLALVMFLLFHGVMNLVVVFSPDAYNAICHFLGANWYALVGTVGLAGLVVLHFVFAIMITIQNRRARGNDRYAVSGSRKEVEYSSKNMLALGIIVLGFLFLHLYNFWYKMQLVEIMHHTGNDFGDASLAANGFHYVKLLFSNPVYCIAYLVWLGAIWYHLTHGIWSALQTLGLSNTVWMKRIKCLSYVLATVVVLLFVAVVLHYLYYSISNNAIAYVW